MLEKAQRRQPFAMVVDCFDPHEPWSPPRKYIDLYSDPDYTGQEIGVTNYGFASNFTPELFRRLHAIYAGEVTMTDRWLGHFMERFYELGLDENTGGRAALGPRIPARRARIHRQGALSSTPSSPRCR